jgi:hypothetical protein
MDANPSRIRPAMEIKFHSPHRFDKIKRIGIKVSVIQLLPQPTSQLWTPLRKVQLASSHPEFETQMAHRINLPRAVSILETMIYGQVCGQLIKFRQLALPA